MIKQGTQENIIRRERLLSLLKSNADKSLILLCYPAGSGKTTLVRDFLSANKFSYGWVNVSDDIGSVYDFLTFSIHSLRKISPNFGTNTSRIIKSLKQSASSDYTSNLNQVITTAAGTFINDFCAVFDDDDLRATTESGRGGHPLGHLVNPNEIFLVLDDFHNISTKGGWLNPTMSFLFQNIPSNLHFIITSRQVPEFNLSYLNAKRKMFQPGREELNFTHDETKELLEKIYSVECSGEEIAAMQEALNGWVTGIHLAVQASKGQGMTQRVPAASLRSSQIEKGMAESIFEFFAKEIFEGLDDEVKSFLLETALLQSFDDKLCDEILEVNNSKEIITGLINKNIFIEPLGDGYRYHALFKNFLLSKLYEAKSDSEIKESVKKICNYFLKNNDAVSVINYLLIGKQFDKAADMILKIGMKLLEENSYENLARWLQLIPGQIILVNPYLLYFKGRLSKYFISDLPSSIELYSRAIELCRKMEDARSTSLQLDCYLTKAAAFSSLGKPGESLNTLKHLLKMKLTPAYKVKMLYSTAFAYYRNTEYLKSIKLLDELFELVENEKVEYHPEQSLNLMGLNYYGMGEFPKAELYFGRVIDAAENIFIKFRASTYLQILYSNSGNYKKAKELSDKTKSLGHFPGTFLELDSYMGVLNLNFDTADYENVIRTCEKILSLCDKLGYPDSKKFAHLFMARAYYYLHKWEMSKANYDAGSGYLRKDDPWSINFDVWKTILSKETNSVPFAGLEKTFLEQYKFCESKNYGIDKCEVAFNLAGIYLNNGKPESAAKYLKEALATAEEKQYVSFLERELLDSRALFDFALTENINKDFVKSIFENVLARLNLNFLSDESRVRISGQIDRLYDISMSSSREPEFKVRGEPVPKEKWVGKKSKLLLAYLMKNPDKKLTKDKIIDMFFPDLSTDSVDQAFHNTISNLRNAVSINSLHPIIYEHKELKLNPDCYFKIDPLLLKD